MVRCSKALHHPITTLLTSPRGAMARWSIVLKRVALSGPTNAEGRPQVKSITSRVATRSPRQSSASKRSLRTVRSWKASRVWYLLSSMTLAQLFSHCAHPLGHQQSLQLPEQQREEGSQDPLHGAGEVGITVQCNPCP
jgi:hypothetical protein